MADRSRGFPISFFRVGTFNGARVISLGGAILILAFVVDLPRVFIEIFNVRVPLLGGNPPYLLLPAISLACVYLYLRGVRSIREAVEPVDLMFLLAMLVCASIEAFHWISGKTWYFGLLTETLWWFLAYYVVRQHFLATGAVKEFIAVAIAFFVTIGVIHFIALGLVALGGITDIRLSAEIFGRSGITLLLVAAVYLMWFGLPGRESSSRWHSAAVVILTLLHAVANQARAALFAMLVLMVARIAWKSGRYRKPMLAALTGAIAIGVSVVCLGYPTLVSLGQLPSVDAVLRDPASTPDSTKSIVYRLAVNTYLLEKVADSPFVGIGGREATAERVGGYPSHTYYLMLFATYGFIGTMAYGIAMGFLLFRRRSSRASAVVLGMLLITILTFVNDLYGWLAMLIATITTSPNVLSSGTRIDGQESPT